MLWRFGGVEMAKGGDRVGIGGMMVLAQQGLVHVERLTGGAWWEVWLIERSWLTGAVLMVAGVIAAYVLAGRGQKRAGMGAAAAGVVLGGGVMVIGLTVETDRERIRVLTERFVERFVAGDSAALDEMMAERVALLSAGSSVDADRDLLISASRATPISEFAYSGLGSTIDTPNSGRTRFSVRTTHSGLYTGRVNSAWELEWARGRDGAWRIVTFECLHIFNRAPGTQWVEWARRVSR